jgi:hypothetical protein
VTTSREVAVTVDVEGDFGTESLRGVDEMMPVLLDGFERLGVRAVLFVVGEVARKRPAVMREAAERGHVVGSHTMSHLAMTAATRAQRRAELADSKAAIEDVTGRPCVAFRAPFFDTPADLGPVLEETGYLWSSSKAPFSPIAHYRWFLATREAHKLEGSHVWEFPVPGFLGLPIPEGLSYRRLFWPATEVDRGFPRMFYVHPYELLDGVDGFAYRPWMRPLMTFRRGHWARSHFFRLLADWKSKGAVFVPPDVGSDIDTIS